MSDARILLIDDDRKLGEMLRDFLAPDKLDVTVCLTGEAGLEKLSAERFDLVILDIMLPGKNGLEVLRELRPANDVPVIMLTARGEDVDRIIGLEVGADDYLAKPFNPRELTARVKAILRRTRSVPDIASHYETAGLQLDTRRRRVTFRNDALSLTGTEFEILRCLISAPGDVISKDTLSEQALGRRLLPFDRSIDTHISNLRQKLSNAGASGVTISNQRGVGYVLLPGD